ncbi:MAG: adenine phosphoribosyltransferase [Thermoleophilia bacterium]|nr:adenine phosphoribosyltransferase [Thermoleophilia bacterium]
MRATAFDIEAAIRKIPDHPTRGILFYDLMPLFQSPAGLSACIDRIAAWARDRQPEVVLGAEARGFILGGALAQALGIGFAAARKPGRLPAETVREEYDLEYGSDALEVHRDAIRPGQKVLVHDDLLATGGTALAKCRLVEALGGHVVGIAFVVELGFLPGRERLRGYDVLSLVRYHEAAEGEGS